MKPVKVEVPFSTPWFEVVGKTMREGEAPYYSLRLADYVSVVAITEDGKVLIVRQYRPAVEQYTLEVPSGLVDPGETPQETGRRELLEETGYQADEVELLGGMRTDVGRMGNRIYTCIARNVRRVDRAPEEGIEVFAWSLEELSAAIADGRFDHALHVAVVLIAMVKGGLKLPQA
jgi:ADP-ribose pyrophosphatase